jgi:protein tyrosine/serine phosphatase
MRVKAQISKTSTVSTRTRLQVGVARYGTIALIVVALLLVVYVFYTVENNNFHIVASGRAYRAAQMTGSKLARCIQEYGIKSILNLRGENHSTSWYQSEVAVAGRMKVIHYDEHLASGDELTVKQMTDLIVLLRRAPKPILIHCEAGADRTGLVSALYCFALEGQCAEESAQQLSIWYGHAPLIRPAVSAMDRSFIRYVAVPSNQLAP